jgi:hypothetical protein
MRTWQVVGEWLVVARVIFDALRVVHGEECSADVCEWI